MLLLLLFGIIEFAQIMYVRQTLISAANVGAYRAIRAGATHEIVVGVTQQALDGGGLSASGIVITYTSGTGPDDLRETVTVSVPYADISFLGGMFGDIPLESACTMFRGQYD